MTTKLIDGQQYEVKEITGHGTCLVPVKEPDPIFKVGDKLKWSSWTYLVYCTAGSCESLGAEYGILFLGSGVYSHCTVGGKLFKTLEELSDYARNYRYKKVN